MGKKNAPAQSPPAAAPGSGLLGELLRRHGFEASTEVPPASEPAGADGATALDLGRCAKIVLRRERKGHGGHAATVVAGLGLGAAQLEEVALQLRKALGCGARVESDTVVVQGDVTDRVRAWLARQGARRVVGP